jgi:hypothetical protein
VPGGSVASGAAGFEAGVPGGSVASEVAGFEAGGAGGSAARPVAVLALLALAGLLRPEAWVFSGLYWLYLLVAGTPRLRARALALLPGLDSGPARDGSGSPPGGALTPRRLAALAVLAGAAPLLWVLSDLLVTGDALWSLSNTRHTARLLGRETGIGKVPEYIPRRLGEILRPPVLLGAALGGVLSLLWLPRRRALLPALAGVAAVAVFALFAAFGLPINSRYAFLAAALLCVFCGAGVFGWTLLPAGDRRRTWWMAGAAVVVVALLAYLPAQYRGAHRELTNLARQQQIEGDLLTLVARHTVSLGCGRVGVPNHRPIPLLALRLRTSPANIVSAQVRRVDRGIYLDPATREVEREFILDPLDPAEPRATVPQGFALVGADRSWRVYRRCA